MNKKKKKFHCVNLLEFFFFFQMHKPISDFYLKSNIPRTIHMKQF